MAQLDIPSSGLATFVADLANRQGIRDVRTGQGVITSLAGDDAASDRHKHGPKLGMTTSSKPLYQQVSCRVGDP